MGIIRPLPENLINQIAAGEVVERPASVVKELIENSLDAGAKRLIIEVEGGGENYLRITDDGRGMDNDDALKSLERYATSKISSAEDLDNIRTLGFRGEALATIASVSFLTLQTKPSGALEGTVIVSEGGMIVKNKEAGCPEGTQIEVKNLFFNTPARKKYLKNETTEYGHILDTVTGLALAFPEVAFKLVRDSKVVFDLPATEDSLSRIRGLLGRNVSTELIPVFYGHSQISLHGYIGKPAIARNNRNGQHLFVNGREVASHVLSYAVKQSYYSLLPKEKNPVFVLFLNISPNLVDVNVHPRKLEVRFADEKEIFGVFLNACKTALEKYVLAPGFETQGSFLNDREHAGLEKTTDAGAFEASARTVTEAVTAGAQTQTDDPATFIGGALIGGELTGGAQTLTGGATAKNGNVLAGAAAENVGTPASTPAAYEYRRPVSFSGLVRESVDGFGADGAPGADESARSEAVFKMTEADETPAALERTDEAEMVPLAQLNNSYILCRQGGGLVIIDQHAAHERVRYEEIVAGFEANEIVSQPLLAPEQLELSMSEAALLSENTDILKEMGFEIEPFGGNTFSVFAVPAYLVKEDIAATVRGIIDDINNRAVKGDLQSRKEKALTYAACRSAVKFGDPLSMEEMESLVKKLRAAKLPYTCPHGRPTMISLSKENLEKKFGRKY